VPGFDAYKADVVAYSHIAESQSDFQADVSTWIYTYRVVPGHFAGPDVTTFFVVYLVVQLSASQPDTADRQYNYYFVYAFISMDTMVWCMVNQDFIGFPWSSMGGEAVDVDGDGCDEIVLHCDTGGSGGTILLSVYHYDGTGLVDYPLGLENAAVSLQATIQPGGNYIMASPDTGYSKTFHSDTWNQPSDDPSWDSALQYGFGVDIVTNFSVVDVDGDGIVEIGIENVYYYDDHANKCGAGIEVYKYDAALGRFKAIWTTYIRVEDAADGNLYYDDLGAVIKQLYK